MEDIRKTAETIAKEATKARERVQEVADTAWEKGHETWKDVREKGEAAWDRGEEIWADAQKLVRKYPAAALGVALLAGTIIGAMMKRSNSSKRLIN